MDFLLTKYCAWNSDYFSSKLCERLSLKTFGFKADLLRVTANEMSFLNDTPTVDSRGKETRCTYNSDEQVLIVYLIRLPGYFHHLKLTTSWAKGHD